MNEQEIENEIQRKNLNAPRLTPELIDATIKNEQYYIFPGTTLTICRLELINESFSIINYNTFIYY